jgi:hypothetical protein
MSIKDLLERLKQLPSETTFKHGFSGSGYSYRGDYYQVSFTRDTNVEVETMIDSLEGIIGQILPGYKGGEFVMHDYVDVYIVDEYDNCGTLVDDYIFNLWLELSDIIVYN